MSMADQRMMDEQARRQAEMQQEQLATERGLAEAQQGRIDLSQFSDSDIIDALSTPDIGRDDPEVDIGLEELLAGEFGKHLAFGNIDRREWDRQVLLDKSRSRLLKCEFPRDGRIGSRCRGRVHEIMVPDENERPVLTDDIAREIDAAYEERTMARSLSIDAKGFEGVMSSIVQTFNRREGGDESRQSRGLLGRLFS